jgi:hypothetical protein
MQPSATMSWVNTFKDDLTCLYQEDIGPGISLFKLLSHHLFWFYCISEWFPVCEIWGSHGGEHTDVRLLGCSTVNLQVDTNISEKHIISMFMAALKIGTVCFSDTLVPTHKSTVCYIPEDWTSTCSAVESSCHLQSCPLVFIGEWFCLPQWMACSNIQMQQIYGLFFLFRASWIRPKRTFLSSIIAAFPGLKLCCL